MAGPSSPLPEPMIALSGWFTSSRSLPMPVKTVQSQLDKYPTPIFGHIEVADGRVWMLPEGVRDFAGDLSEQEQKVVWATHFAPDANLFNQKVYGTAWKTKPSWSIVATEDRTVHPDLERFLAKRNGRNDRRGEEQPRDHAVAAATRPRCDPKSGKSRSRSHGNSVKCLFVSPARARRLNAAGSIVGLRRP